METTDPAINAYEEFEKLPEGAPYQLIRGGLVHEPAPSIAHQLTVKRLTVALDRAVTARGLGIVIPSPVDVRLAELEIYQPDIVFIASGRLSIVGENRIEGPPDLVVEVLSFSSAYYDLRHKRDVYAASGVREYLVVDPITKTVELLANVDGTFIDRSGPASSGSIEFRTLDGAAIDVSEMFRMD